MHPPAVDGREQGDRLVLLEVPREVAVEQVDIGLCVALGGDHLAGPVGADPGPQVAQHGPVAALGPPAAAAQRMAVRRVEAQARGRGGHLVDVDAVDVALGPQEAQHDVAHRPPPQGRRRAHRGEFLARAVLLGVGRPVLALGGGRDAEGFEVLEVRVPQAAVDVGHDADARLLERLDPVGETVFRREVVRVVVVKRDLVPVVPVQRRRDAEVFGERLDGLDDAVGVAARDGPDGDVLHPVGRVGAVLAGTPWPPGRVGLDPGAVEEGEVEPVAAERLDHEFARLLPRRAGDA